MKEPRHHLTNIIFTISLFGLFVMVSLTLVLLGSNVYKDTHRDMTDNYDIRTSLTYITEKIRQCEEPPQLRTAADHSALVLPEDIGGKTYETWIFFNGETLREVTVAAGTAVHPQDGQSIMALKGLSFVEKGSLLTVEIKTTKGETFSTSIETGRKDL